MAAIEVFVTCGLVLTALHIIDSREALGRRQGQDFVDKVVACRRRPDTPHLAWGQCELRVRATE